MLRFIARRLLKFVLYLVIGSALLVLALIAVGYLFKELRRAQAAQIDLVREGSATTRDLLREQFQATHVLGEALHMIERAQR